MSASNTKFIEKPFKKVSLSTEKQQSNNNMNTKKMIEKRSKKARKTLSKIDLVTGNQLKYVYLDPTILADDASTIIETDWLDENLYTPASVVKEEKGIMTLRLTNGDVVKTIPNCYSIKVTEDDDAGVNDILLLRDFSEQSMLYTLRVRYSRDLVYTFVGPILISVNPYKKLSDLYSLETMSEYHGKPRGVSKLGMLFTLVSYESYFYIYTCTLCIG